MSYPVKAFVFTPSALRKVIANSPFDSEKDNRTWRRHMMFLSERPSTQAVKHLIALQGSEYRFTVKNKALYYTYPTNREGQRRTVNFERVLGVSGTARTFEIITALAELSLAVERTWQRC